MAQTSPYGRLLEERKLTPERRAVIEEFIRSRGNFTLEPLPQTPEERRVRLEAFKAAHPEVRVSIAGE